MAAQKLTLLLLGAEAVSSFSIGTPLRTMPARTASPAMVDYVSDSAAAQQGNNAFLNENLMERAINGPGVKSKSKLKIGIVGAGLAGMVAAMDLADAGHDVEMFELRPFVGGKVSSWKDKDENHIEMGLHVFFGCYYNLFGIMKRTGSFDLLRLKEHTHTFINNGGSIGELDFRFPIGAPVSGLQAFARTQQIGTADKLANALRLGTSPIVRALVDFDVSTGPLAIETLQTPAVQCRTLKPTPNQDPTPDPAPLALRLVLGRPAAESANRCRAAGRHGHGARPRQHHVHRVVHPAGGPLPWIGARLDRSDVRCCAPPPDGAPDRGLQRREPTLRGIARPQPLDAAPTPNAAGGTRSRTLSASSIVTTSRRAACTPSSCSSPVRPLPSFELARPMRAGVSQDHRGHVSSRAVAIGGPFARAHCASHCAHCTCSHRRLHAPPSRSPHGGVGAAHARRIAADFPARPDPQVPR